MPMTALQLAALGHLQVGTALGVAVPAPAPALLYLSQPVTGQARAVHRHTHGGDHPEANTSVSCVFDS